MGRTKQEPAKILSRAEQEKLEALYKEEEAITDWLFENSSDDQDFDAMARCLREVGKKILDLEGKAPLDVNSDFRR